MIDMNQTNAMDFEQTLKLWREFLRIRRTALVWGDILKAVYFSAEPISLEEACVLFSSNLLRLEILAHEEPKQARKTILDALDKRYLEAFRSLKPSTLLTPYQIFGLHLRNLSRQHISGTKQVSPVLLQELDHVLRKRRVSRSLKSYITTKETECKMELSKINSSLEKARAALYAIIDEIDEDQPPDSNQIYDAACLLKDRISPEFISFIVSAWKRELRAFIEYYSHSPHTAESHIFWENSGDADEFTDAVSHYRMMECFGIGDFSETMRSVEKLFEEELMNSILEERSISWELWIASRSKTLCNKANQQLVQRALNFIIAEQNKDGWMAHRADSYGRAKPEPNTLHTALGALVIFRLGQDSEILEKGKSAINWLTKQQRNSGAWAHYHTKWRRARLYKGKWSKPKKTIVLLDDLFTTILAVDGIRRSGLSGYEYTLKKAEEWILRQQSSEGLWTERAENEEGALSDVFITTLVLEYFDGTNTQGRKGEDVTTSLVASSSSNAPNTRADNILIVTVTKIEAQAVLRTFSKAAGKKWTRQAIGNKTYYDLGLHGGAPVFMVQSEMGSATPAGALLTVRQAIQDLRPQAVIMCGISFGLRQGMQKLGDILVTKQLEYYEPQKVDVQKRRTLRGDRALASERLLGRFRSGEFDWKGAPLYFGLILSGEKLINNLAFRKALLKTRPEAIGGEMEGAGLYAAARDAKVDWILVKAICDWADGKKNAKAQPVAARNAAKFVLHVLQQGGWGATEQ